MAEMSKNLAQAARTYKRQEERDIMKADLPDHIKKERLAKDEER